MNHLLSALSAWIEHVIRFGGYPGIVLLMTLESACIPLPSEVIMPFAGAITVVSIASAHGTAPLNLHLVAWSGALGCLLGSALAWWVGAKGGREFIYKYGRYILLRKKDVERSEIWFQRRGEATVFLARLLPVVRTFISLPAGIANMNFPRFLLLSFVGSLPWCYALAWLGVLVQGHIRELKVWFHGADALITAAAAVLFVLWLKHHLQPDEEESA